MENNLGLSDHEQISIWSAEYTRIRILTRVLDSEGKTEKLMKLERLAGLRSSKT